MNDKQSSESVSHDRHASSEAASSNKLNEVKDKLSEAAEPVKDQARSIAEKGRRASADQVERLGAAGHSAARELEKDLPKAARYVNSAAESLEQASAKLRDHSIEELAGEFGEFARSQPAAAFAASVLAGFALARLLKSSSQPPRRA